jgi:RHS repeat-associated protein
VQNRLTASVDQYAGGVTIGGFEYTLDANGNRTREDDADESAVVYTYDALNRVTSEKQFDSTGTLIGAETYSYDAVGNVTSRSGTLPGNATFSYNGDNQLISGAGSTYKYDSAGNLVSVTDNSGGVTRYSYDDRGRLISSQTPDGATTTYTYNYQGVRESQAGPGGLVKYLVDAANGPASAQVIRESGPSGVTLRSYVIGLQLLSFTEGTNVRYYLTDALGSTRLLTDATGAVTDKYLYSAYGVPLGHTGSSDNSFLFAGQQQGEPSGLVYLRARYYDPATGRFLSRDASDGSDQLPLSLNKYVYALANPVNDTDPSGNQTLVELVVSLAINATLRVSGIVLDAYKKAQWFGKAMQAIGGAMTLFTVFEGALHPTLLGLYFGGLGFPTWKALFTGVSPSPATIARLSTALGYPSLLPLGLTAFKMLRDVNSTMYFPGTLRPKAVAYVKPDTSLYTVYINPQFITYPVFPELSLEPCMVGIIVHEFVHLASHGVIRDILYKLPSLGLPPILAYFNADNYRLAVQGSTFGILNIKQLLDALGISIPGDKFQSEDS